MHADLRCRFCPPWLGNIGAHTAALSGHVWLVIAPLFFGTLLRNLGSVRLNSELTLTAGFGRLRRLGGFLIGKWSTADTTRMLTLSHVPLLSGLTTSAGKAGVSIVPLSNGVMRNTRRAFNSRFLLGPRALTHVSFCEAWLKALPLALRPRNQWNQHLRLRLPRPTLTDLGCIMRG